MRSFVVTAYTHTGNRTTSGRWPKSGKTVAVDPQIIPLGSRIYIDGIGWRIAEDTGPAIKNNALDVFMDTKKECLQWGRRTVEVYIVH